MRGVSVVYMAPVLADGEDLDTLKHRFSSGMRLTALQDARAIAAKTGGRVLQWAMGAAAPQVWID